MKLKEINLTKKHITTIVCIILLPLVMLCVINLTPNYRNISKLNKIGNKIETCNKKLKNSLENDSINSSKAKEILTNELLELSNIQKDLESTEITQKNYEFKSKLSETLNYNITLYQLTLSIIKNPNSNDTFKTYTEYTKTYELLKSNYKTLDLLGLDIEFPSEAEEFFTKETNFFNTLIKLNRENDIKLNQKSSYVSNIEDCITVLDSINEDLKPALIKIHEDNRPLDTLLKDVKDKRNKFNELKIKSTSFSIPENGNECYQILQDTLNYYELYIIALEDSIIIEKTSSNDNEKYITKNYKNSFEKYNDFTDSFNELKTQLDNFNKK